MSHFPGITQQVSGLFDSRACAVFAGGEPSGGWSCWRPQSERVWCSGTQPLLGPWGGGERGPRPLEGASAAGPALRQGRGHCCLTSWVVFQFRGSWAILPPNTQVSSSYFQSASRVGPPADLGGGCPARSAFPVRASHPLPQEDGSR